MTQSFNLRQINHYLDEVGEDFEDELQAKRDKAEREKEKGNGAYKRGMFQRAAKHFTNAMELVSLLSETATTLSSFAHMLLPFRTLAKWSTLSIDLCR